MKWRTSAAVDGGINSIIQVANNPYSTHSRRVLRCHLIAGDAYSLSRNREQMLSTQAQDSGTSDALSRDHASRLALLDVR